MSDVLSASTVDCHTIQDVACSDHCAITVTLNFDQSADTSERLLTIMSIFLSGCMLSGKLPSTLMHVVIIPLKKCKSKDPADVNNYRPISIATALSKALRQVLLSRLTRYLWTADSRLKQFKTILKQFYFHTRHDTGYI